MSALPPLQPSTPAEEWGSSTLSAIDAQKTQKEHEYSTGASLTAVPGEPTSAPVPPTHTTISSTVPATTTNPAIPSSAASTHTPVTTTTSNTLPHTAVTDATALHSTTAAGAIPSTTAATSQPLVGSTDHPISAVSTAPTTGTTATTGGYPLDTPGPAVPGAFPRTLSEAGRTQVGQHAQAALGMAGEKLQQGGAVAAEQAQVALNAASEQAAVAASSAQSTFANFASSAAQYLPQSVKEQMAPYLPEGTSVTAQASHNDTVHATSLPSTELRGHVAGDKHEGVGALPGSIMESGVAQPENLINAPGSNTNPSVGERAAGYVPQTVKDYAAPLIPGAGAGALTGSTVTAGENDKLHSTSLPTTEVAGSTGTGAGALPGAPTETGVADAAALQDKRAEPALHQPTLAERAGAYIPEGVKAYVPAGLAATAVGAGAVASEHDREHKTSMPTTEVLGGSDGALPGRVGEEGVAKLPAERNPSGAPVQDDTLGARITGARGFATGPAAAAATAASHAAQQAREYVTGQPTTTTSLPSTEKEGILPGERSDGAGPLAGKVGESGVAVLPAERELGTSSSVHPTTSATEHQAVGGHAHDIAAAEATAAAAAATAAAAHHRSDEAPAVPPKSEARDTTASTLTTQPKAKTDIDVVPVPSTHSTTTPAAPSTTTDATKGTPVTDATTKTDESAHKPAPAAADLPQDNAYKTDYHPAELHPEKADYSNVKIGGEETGESKPAGTDKTKTEGELGASAATADKKENDNEVAGLKEGGDRKLHGGVPGDIGGGTMPVGDKHEGGVDSTDPKKLNVSTSTPSPSGIKKSASGGSHDRDASSATSASSPSGKPKFMDKLKGEIKVLSGKISNKPEKVEEGQRMKSGTAQ